MERRQIAYKTPETMSVEGEWPVGAYTWKSWKHMDEFVAGLKQKKLIGSICSSCGKVYFPPSYICGRCFRWIEDRRIVSERGEIVSFVLSEPVKRDLTVMGMKLVEMGEVKEGEIIISALVKFDGSDNLFRTIVLNADPKEVRVGMRVKAVWAKELKGRLSDLEGVEPIRE